MIDLFEITGKPSTSVIKSLTNNSDTSEFAQIPTSSNDTSETCTQEVSAHNDTIDGLPAKLPAESPYLLN